jgi:hypothetical protein
MRPPKRGRPPVGRKAMTGAQRQARWRKRSRERMRQQGQEPPRRIYQPPHGYGWAREKLIAQGHQFTRASRDAGFEEGVFVDGAYLGSGEVIALAEKSPHERKQWLAEQRRDTKHFACGVVEHYMETLRVSLDELIASASLRGRANMVRRVRHST